MSEVLTNRKLRYHDDPHHYLNWCKVCGLYFCWHPECKEHRNDGRTNHVFEPQEEALDEDRLEDDYYNDNWDEI